MGVPSVTFFSCWFAGGIPGAFVFLPISGTISLLSLIMFLQQREISYLTLVLSFEGSVGTKLPVYSLFTCKHTSIDPFPPKVSHFSAAELKISPFHVSDLEGYTHDSLDFSL